MTSNSLKKKIALGTVQFGLHYGINNTSGKPTSGDVFGILNVAASHGIKFLDTADAYGDSLDVIGKYFSECGKSDFAVIGKFVADGNTSVRVLLSSSLKKLGIPKLYGYMYHRFKDYQSGNFSRDLNNLKREGLIDNIGVSLYGLEELKQVVDDPDISLIQLPLNPFDCSPEKLNLLSFAADKGKEIHVRSVFLQGLFFKQPDELTGNLKGLTPALKQFHSIISEFGLNVRSACLNFALHQPSVHHVVVGVEKAAQLIENVNSIVPAFPAECLIALQSIKVKDITLLNPSNWKT